MLLLPTYICTTYTEIRYYIPIPNDRTYFCLIKNKEQIKLFNWTASSIPKLDTYLKKYTVRTLM